MTLKARIQNVSQNKKQDLAGSATFTLNGIDRSQAVQDLHVSHTGAGYIVELRGKNGEPLPGEPLACAFKHRLFRDEVHADLQTDAQGRAWLGELAGIDWFRVKEPAGGEHQWLTARGACAYPAALHGRAGETLRVPLVFDGPEPLTAGLAARGAAAASLSRTGTRPSPSKAASSNCGTCPRATTHSTSSPRPSEIAVAVTQGEDRDGFTFSARRALERPRLAPLQVAAVEPGAEAVEIRLANSTPFTRVHVFATRYLPAYDVFAKLGFTGAPALQQQTWQPARDVLRVRPRHRRRVPLHH